MLMDDGPRVRPPAPWRSRVAAGWRGHAAAGRAATSTTGTQPCAKHRPEEYSQCTRRVCGALLAPLVGSWLITRHEIPRSGSISEAVGRLRTRLLQPRRAFIPRWGEPVGLRSARRTGRRTRIRCPITGACPAHTTGSQRVTPLTNSR